jgi:hypothetical protein
MLPKQRRIDLRLQSDWEYCSQTSEKPAQGYFFMSTN